MHIVGATTYSSASWVEILIMIVGAVTLFAILDSLLKREYGKAMNAWMNDALCEKAREFGEELDRETFCGFSDSRKGDR